jgi:formate C-acetyltransferase
VAGLANVVDSLIAVKKSVFEDGVLTGAELLGAMDANFQGTEPLRTRLASYPRFGNDDPEADELAAELCKTIFDAYRERHTVRGGVFLPSCIMFTTYGSAGGAVGATPDGRMAGEPIADSLGPAYGRDRNGPTAMLNSVSKLPLHLASGTPVVNIRVKKKLLDSQEGRAKFQNLVTTYFSNGGMQIQVNLVDQQTLKDAIAHPEQYEHLIIRIGGFSMRFNALTPELKQSMLERTEHAV